MSMSFDTEVDSPLLIETMAKEHELAGNHMIQDTSKWLTTLNHGETSVSRGNGSMSQEMKVQNSSAIRRSLSYAAVVSNPAQIVEVEGDVDAGLKNNCDYVVQLF